MQRPMGITEAYWKDSLNEDQRIYWKILTRIMTASAAYFCVSKTGYALFDWTVGIFSGFLALLIIESQRGYSKLTPRLRKWITRRVVSLGSGSVALLGGVMFAQAVVVATADVVSKALPNTVKAMPAEITAFLFVPLILGTSFHAALKSFRDLNGEELIFRLPNLGLRRLFVRREFIATTLPLFVAFELSVAVLTLCYCSMVANVSNAIMLLTGFK